MARDKPSRWRKLGRPAPFGSGGSPAPSSPESSDDPLEEALARHERALGEAAGDASLCALAKSGRSWPAVKYHEGAMVALREIRRSEGDRRKAASHMLDVWRRAQDEALAGGMGGDWSAYRAGGIDALSAYLDPPV